MFSSISNLLMNINIQMRLAVSFASLALIIAVISASTIWEVNKLNDLSHRVTDLRIPTVEASAGVLNGTNHALAALRGWMLLNNAQFKDERASAWREEIEPALAVLDKMSTKWINPENISRLNELKGLLAEFESEQQRIEDIANTPENVPAIKLLFDQAAPQASIMLSNITRLIDLEAKQEATAERKALLGMMADVRGTIGLSLANIRAYLLSGETRFQTKYEALWAKNEQRFNDLGNNKLLLTKAQFKAYELFANAREQFAPLPPKMLEMRAKPDWNLANHWLATKAAPIGAQVQSILKVMKANQTELLASDSSTTDKEGVFLKNMAWVLLISGLSLTFFLAIVITRSVVGPVNQLKNVMTTLGRESNLSLRVDNDSADEIGQMAREFNKMLETFDHLILKIASSSIQLSGSAEELHTISGQSHEGISQQQSETEQVATAITQMSATVQEVARNAADASSATTEAEAQANEGRRIVAQVGTSIHELEGEVEEATNVIHALEEESNNIGGVLDVIRGIAEQTNLLALNAAIEAARAGEQGRGFAVVADEVRTLASRTQESTQEIQKMIEHLQAGAQTAVKKMDHGLTTTRANVVLANQATEALDQITNSVSLMTQMNLQIASAAEEQSSVVDEINNNIVAINDISQQTSTGAKETVTASEQLSVLASELQTAAERFKTS